MILILVFVSMANADSKKTSSKSMEDGENGKSEIYLFFNYYMHIIAQRSNVIETDNSVVKIYHKDVLKAVIY